MVLDAVSKALVQAISGLCQELRAMRDDLYNHALITAGESYACAYPNIKTETFTLAQMQPQAGAKVVELFKNNSGYAHVALVHASPVLSQVPPNPLSIEQSAIFLSFVGKDGPTPSKAELTHFSLGEPVRVVVPNGQTLYGSVMASAQVTLFCRTIPLRGRSSTFVKQE